MLSRVTITGADDSTRIEDLMQISLEFPFVEWGVLVGSHEGVPRFPSRSWMERLVDARSATSGPVNLSLHVCGRWLRKIAAGLTLDELLGARLAAFGRVQLNWHGERQGQIAENILSAFCKMDGGFWDPQVIFQLDGVNDHLAAATMRRYLCSGLFDTSHGAGIMPGTWPKQRVDMACGWAGGLGPHNLREQLPRIAESAWPAAEWWVDMETQVRGADPLDPARADVLDLEKVRAALVICHEFMEQQAKSATGSQEQSHST